MSITDTFKNGKTNTPYSDLVPVKGGKTPCEYCKYQAICNFNNGVCKNQYNYIGNINKDSVLDSIHEEGS